MGRRFFSFSSHMVFSLPEKNALCATFVEKSKYSFGKRRSVFFLIPRMTRSGSFAVLLDLITIRRVGCLENCEPIGRNSIARDGRAIRSSEVGIRCHEPRSTGGIVRNSRARSCSVAQFSLTDTWRTCESRTYSPFILYTADFAARVAGRVLSRLMRARSHVPAKEAAVVPSGRGRSAGMRQAPRRATDRN